MQCINCSREIPDAANFCPYCMTKFVDGQVILPKEQKRPKKKVIIGLIAGVIVFVIAGAGLVKKIMKM